MEMITFRIKAEDKELLRNVCDDRSEDISGFIRRSIKKELCRMGYYTESVKALEVKVEN